MNEQLSTLIICILLIFVGIVIGWGVSGSTIDQILNAVYWLVKTFVAGAMVAIWGGLIFLYYEQYRHERSTISKALKDTSIVKFMTGVDLINDEYTTYRLFRSRDTNPEDYLILITHRQIEALNKKFMYGSAEQYSVICEHINSMARSNSCSEYSKEWKEAKLLLDDLKPTLSDYLKIGCLIPIFKT